jgi:hypothetical protein
MSSVRKTVAGHWGRNQQDTDIIDGFKFESSSGKDNAIPPPIQTFQITVPNSFPMINMVCSTLTTPVIKPAEPDVVIIRPAHKNSRKPITLKAFPAEIPEPCRSSKVKLKAYLRGNKGIYTQDDVNAMYVLVRRNSQNKSSKRHRAKLANNPMPMVDKIMHFATPTTKIDAITQTD